MEKKSFLRAVAGISSLLLLTLPAGALADTGSDLQSQLDAVQSDIQQTQDQISAEKAQQGQAINQISQINKDVSGISNEVIGLKNQLVQKNAEKVRAQDTLDKLNAQIARTKEELAANKIKLARDKSVLNNRVKKIYELGEPSTVSIILNTTSFSDFVNRVTFLMMIQEQDARLVNRVKATKLAIENEELQQEKAKQVAEARRATIDRDAQRIEELQGEEQARLASLQGVQAQKAALVDRLKQDQASMLSQVKKEQVSANAIGASLNQWNDRQAAARAAEAAAAAQAAADAQSRTIAATQAAADQAPSPASSMANTRGVDYSMARPGGSAIRGNGYSFVCRYLSDYSGKNLSSDELNDLRANGLAVVLVWETTADRALDGYNAGQQDASAAQEQASALGAPGSAPIYFAVDFDAMPNELSTVNDYLRGAASVIGVERVGVYGGYSAVKSAFDNGTATFGWQACAWSYGEREYRAHIYQDGGVDFDGGADTNIGMQDYIGQW